MKLEVGKPYLPIVRYGESVIFDINDAGARLIYNLTELRNQSRKREKIKRRGVLDLPGVFLIKQRKQYFLTCFYNVADLISGQAKFSRQRFEFYAITKASFQNAPVALIVYMAVNQARHTAVFIMRFHPSIAFPSVRIAAFIW